jgi:hypothetical protein
MCMAGRERRGSMAQRTKTGSGTSAHGGDEGRAASKRVTTARMSPTLPSRLASLAKIWCSDAISAAGCGD